MTDEARWLHMATEYLSGTWRPVALPEPHPPIPLPERRPLNAPLDELLLRRTSCRRFAAEPLELEAVSSLLGAAYGAGATVTMHGTTFAQRPVPSAGARYPLELHLLIRSIEDLPPGAYRYAPDKHALVPTGPAVSFDALAHVFLDQPYLAEAAAVLLVAGALDRTTARYGVRGYRYVLFEAGHAVQNVVLAGTALAAGTLALGGFLDDELAAMLRLPPSVVPLYGVALGSPAGDDQRTSA